MLYLLYVSYNNEWLTLKIQQRTSVNSQEDLQGEFHQQKKKDEIYCLLLSGFRYTK